MAYAVYLGLPAVDVVVWLLLATLATVLIDVDHLLLQLAMPDRRHIVVEIISHPLEHVDWRIITEKTHYPGFGILRMKSHIILTVAAAFISWYYTIPYSTPVVLSLWVHTIMDMGETIAYPEYR